jgi:release factor glutamine methyltransferase
MSQDRRTPRQKSIRLKLKGREEPPQMTLREAQIAAANRLAAEPQLREQASRDATHLLLHALHLPPTALHAHPDRLLSSDEIKSIDALIGRRLTFEPIQYIFGEQEFYGLSFLVTLATLIPRPETELLVEAVLQRLPRGTHLRLADVGTGSGAIAVALAHHLPLAHILALDLSPDALEVASQNAHRNGLDERIHFRLSDLLEARPPNQPFDVIVSNPPYIPETDRPTLHPQVRDHEPPTALFAGADGLAVYRRLIPQAWHALKPNGLLAMEFGHGQSEALKVLLADCQEVEFLDDLQRIPRIALARKPQ